MLKHIFDLARGGWRYATGLRAFFSITINQVQAEAILKAQLDGREDRFLRILELGVYSNPQNPYRKLLLHAGFKLEDVRRLVHDKGLEEALSTLHDAGVYVTLDEFKGRAPIRRPGLEFPVRAQDFDNPLLTAHYEGSTGGSRGDPTRVHIDLDFIAYEAAIFFHHFLANSVADRPVVMWGRADPPVLPLSIALRMARFGCIVTRWLSPTRGQWNRQALQGRALLAYTLLVSRLFGKRLPWPKYMPDVKDLVTYLAQLKRAGTPALVTAYQSDAVRICLMAEEMGTDISGTVFFCGGEPYTEGKAAVLARVGADCIPHYAMHETGSVAFRCGTPSCPDDMHLMKDKLAVLPRPKQLDSGPEVQAFFHTSLLTSLPKIMLNVESGDYGVLEERDCGCVWQRLGFTTHISNVRSYEKLTSEGVMFMGSMLHELLEQTLPARFGGSPLDYQFVEEEEDGLPRVRILVSPELGPIDEKAVVDAIIESLSFSDWSRRMARTWRKAGTLTVVRREPYVLGAKLLPLRVIRPQPDATPTTPASGDAPPA